MILRFVLFVVCISMATAATRDRKGLVQEIKSLTERLTTLQTEYQTLNSEFTSMQRKATDLKERLSVVDESTAKSIAVDWYKLSSIMMDYSVRIQKLNESKDDCARKKKQLELQLAGLRTRSRPQYGHSH